MTSTTPHIRPATVDPLSAEPTTHPALKFCGLRCAADVAAVNALAEHHALRYAGFVFFPPSKRNVSPAEAAKLRSALDARIESVGVFVNADIDSIVALAQAGTISIAQLHGTENASYIAQLRAAAPQLRIWKAFEIPKDEQGVCVNAESAAFAQLANAINSCTADLVLIDSGKGSGLPFNWACLARITRPFALAGGLSSEKLPKLADIPSEVRARIRILDVSSGIEDVSDHGSKNTESCKSPSRMQHFLQTYDELFPAPALTQKGTHMSNETTPKSTPTPASTSTAGRFGIHGGQYIPETLMNAVIELEDAYNHYKDDPAFKAELQTLLNEYAGRPSLLYFAERMTNDLGGAKIYLKREDLNHTGAHKINNVLGQALLAKKMGKTRLIAETGAGQHGVATATAAALFGMECDVYMGKEDTDRQALNVYKMRLLGARVHPVTSGTATLKDAVSETMREWTNRIRDAHYCLGSPMGPHPFPIIVRDFQAVISAEIKEQCLALEGRLPNVVMACVGGGSNAMGTFYNFIEDEDVRLIGCEAAGRGIDAFETAATINTGSIGIFHGMKSYFCQDEYGQIAPMYSISAGLDYPGVGPEHANLYDSGRAEYVAITDDEAVDAFEYLSRIEGIIPAIESSHAVAHAIKIAHTMRKADIVVVTLSGRGDKDCAAIARYRGEDISE